MRRPAFGLGQVITRSARLYAEMPCLQAATGMKRTFAEVDERVNRLANSLAARGVTKDTRIAVLAQDSFAYVELLLASFKLGATFIPLDCQLTMEEIGAIAPKADADFLFVSGLCVAMGRRLLAGLSAPPQLLSLDGSLGDDLADLIGQGNPAELYTSLEDDDVLVIMFSTDAAGVSHGVLQSHRMLKGIALQQREFLSGPGEVRYTAMPLSSAAGLSALLGCLTAGCASLIISQFDASTTNLCIESGLLTGCHLRLPMISAVLDLDRPPRRAGRLRTMIYAGGPAEASLLKRAVRRWPDCGFWNLYGVRPESSVQACLRPEDHRRAIGGEEVLLQTMGQPVAGVDMRILGADGRDVPLGSVGQVAVRMDEVMSGYLDDPELTSSAFSRGWFVSGDAGRLDSNGYLSVTSAPGRVPGLLPAGLDGLLPWFAESDPA
jgi:acyl-CoA synthetase (AMP-forming)/AMP-acid ligase II